MTQPQSQVHAGHLASCSDGEEPGRHCVSWSPSTPRAGLAGVLDRFIGPRASRAELWLQLTIPMLAAGAAVWWPIASGNTWAWWQLLIAGFLALDVVGGVMTNATHTAKRWYHRAGQTPNDHLRFVAGHLLQLTLVGWLFRSHDWGFVAASYGGLLIGTLVIIFSPLYLQKPIAHGVYLLALVAALSPKAVTPGLEWFVPVFYLKLFIAHLPFEAPLALAQRAPDSQSSQGA